MRRRGLLRGVAATALPARMAWAQGRDLTVVSWGGAYQDAQREAYFRPWMTSRSQRMLEETWHGGIGVLRERVVAGSNTWDVVQLEGEELLIGCAEGLFERLDWDAIGGRDAYVPEAVHDCGVGAILYAVVLAWDRDRLQTSPRGWADLFDPVRIPGRRGLRRSPKTTLEIALLADGVPPGDIYRVLGTEAGTERAFRKLDAIRPHLSWWDRGSQPPQWLATGDVVLAAAYNGRIAALNAEAGRNVGTVWEGNLTSMGFWAVMRGTPNRMQAHDFLNFVGQAPVQAALPIRIPYAVTARGVTLPPEVTAQLPTAPARAASTFRIDDRFWLDHLDRLTRRFDAWLGR